MSKPQDYLFLLASDGRARLVRHSLVDAGYVTTWRGKGSFENLARQIILQADAQIIDCRLEGLVIVARGVEVTLLRDRLERDVAIVGTIDANLIDVPNDLLGADLDRVREGSGR